MNPGVGEEVGKTARTFMDSMKEQPLALALCMMNIGLLALFWYIGSWAVETRRTEFQTIMQHNAEINKLLYQCVPTDRRGDFKLQSDESHPVMLPPKEGKKKDGQADDPQRR